MARARADIVAHFSYENGVHTIEERLRALQPRLSELRQLKSSRKQNEEQAWFRANSANANAGNVFFGSRRPGGFNSGQWRQPHHSGSSHGSEVNMAHVERQAGEFVEELGDGTTITKYRMKLIFDE